MKISEILILSSLTVIVKGAWWAAAAQPVLLGLGAAFATIDLDIQQNNFHIPTWEELWQYVKVGSRELWKEINGALNGVVDDEEEKKPIRPLAERTRDKNKEKDRESNERSYFKEVSMLQNDA